MHIPRGLTLQGRYVELRPLGFEHVEALNAAAADGELWLSRVSTIPDSSGMLLYIENALADREAGTAFPFVVIERSTNRVLGSTRFYNISKPHRNVSIGYTWYSKSAQRTGVNTDCKLCLLEYAFEQLQVISVAWHTHHDNLASQKAIERLGAVKEGVLRNHMIMPDESIRHTVCYSMTDEEWPQAKQQLQTRLR